MPRLALNSGSYAALSVISNAQRCINLYQEDSPKEVSAETPLVHYPTPGLTLQFVFPDLAEVRCLYRTYGGLLYGVCGSSVYAVGPAPTWELTLLGSLNTNSGFVSMSDNNIQILIVDGSTSGYTITLANNIFAQMSAATNSGTNGYGFSGADRVDYSDSFFVCNLVGTNQWIVSNSNSTNFDSLQIVAKAGAPDPVVGVAVLQRFLYIIGTLESEIWYNAGGATFPFAIVNGPYIKHGATNAATIIQGAESLFWVMQDKRGALVAVEAYNYATHRISNYAVETEWQSYNEFHTMRSFCYQINGHLFYVVTFPKADRTWVYDKQVGQWHEWAWADSDGVLHRHRGQTQAYVNDVNLVGDWQNGKVYKIDPTNYTDDGAPIQRLRRFPHVISDEDQRIVHNQFIADMEVGRAGQSDLGQQTNVSLRWSDDRGVTWGSQVQQSLGGIGEFKTSLSWRRLGMARDRVYELRWTAQFRTALQGAFISGPLVSKT